MRVPCSEGIANQTGPESCVVHREVPGEALTGETVGPPLSRESYISVQGLTPLAWRKPTRTGTFLGVPGRPCVAGAGRPRYFAYHAVPPTAGASGHSGTMWSISGDDRSYNAASGIARPRTGWRNSRRSSCLRPTSFIPRPAFASPSNTQGGSPVRESRPPGSVRGVRSNAHPYRDSLAAFSPFPSRTRSCETGLCGILHPWGTAEPMA